MAEIAKNVIDLAVEAAVSDARKRDAAPELYEALNELLIVAGEGDRRGRAIDLLPRKYVNAARAALAKARGETS